MNRTKYLSKVMLVVFLSVIMLVGCGSETHDNFVNEGKQAVEDGNYDLAKASFELAVEAKGTDRAKDMLAAVEDFIAGLEAKGRGQIDEAIDYFNSITEGNGSLPTLVNKALALKAELGGETDESTVYTDRLNEAEALFESGDYEASQDILNQIIEETKEKEALKDYYNDARDLLEKVNVAIKADKPEKEKEQAKSEAKEAAQKEKETKKAQEKAEAEEAARKQAEAKKQKQAEEDARKKAEEEAKQKEAAEKQAVEEKTDASSINFKTKAEVDDIIRGLDKGGITYEEEDRFLNGELCYEVNIVWKGGNRTRHYWIGNETLNVYDYDGVLRGNIYDFNDFESL